MENKNLINSYRPITNWSRDSPKITKQYSFKKINTKQFSIWFIKSMSEIGSWSELENFTKQRGVGVILNFI